MSNRKIQYSLYLIFTLSGATGLIYESIWSHYLKQFLGHAAYAQTLVLIIFMGGMALGAWLASRYSNLLPNMLIGYAIIEGIVGIFGIVFHSAYLFIFDLSFSTVIPSLASPGYVHIYKFLVASILILPQSILLGATFPLMSGGFIRKFPDAPGHTISFLYFANSIGAAVAVLVSAFYLIAIAGLPGTMLTAGIINIFISISVYFLAKDQTLYSTLATNSEGEKSWQLLILGAAFFTGMASFIYEIAWIRMLSMVLGASTHSFELMLSAFITGLAIGGYWIRNKIENLKNPVLFAALVQMIMGSLALLSIVLYNHSFYLQAFFMSALSETSQGYTLFNIVSHGIALLIMLPTTICAGMTLPLLTYILINKGYGEKSIGQIYSSNTIGAIFGVLFTVFIGMPLLTLKGAVFSGAMIDIVIGIVLVRAAAISIKYTRTVYISAFAGALILMSAIMTEFDTNLMASSVFRQGLSDQNLRSEVIYHKDGKTASISVTNWRDVSISIITNGKPDAAMTTDEELPPSKDESTMTLLGALPLAVKPDAEYVANIGLGSGLTSHVVLASPNVKRIDTIEIESAIVEGAKFFGSKTERVYSDPRSHIHVDDAKTFFSTHQNKYDVIISEPSNPWVSGVSSLFSQEFYKNIKLYLNPGGILVQWIHIYEFNLELLVSVLKAISHEFTSYNIYFADDGNLILIASEDLALPIASDDLFEIPDMANQLFTIFVNNVDDIRFRYLGNQDIFDPYLDHSAIPVNSDFFPYLDQNATRARFLKQNVSEILDLRLYNVPILDLLYDTYPRRTNNISTTEFYPSTGNVIAKSIYDYFNGRIFDKEIISAIAGVNFLRSSAENCNLNYNETVWIDSIYLIFNYIIPFLTHEQAYEMLEAFVPSCNLGYENNSHLSWLNLYKAILDKNYTDINISAAALLTNNKFNDLDQKKYLLTTFLIGLIKTGAYQDALDFWKGEMAEVFISNGDIPLAYELLLAQIQVNN